MEDTTPLPDPSFREAVFEVGQMVEVRPVEGGCDGGAWYKATINKILLEPQPDKAKYVVAFESHFDDSLEYLKQETIKVSHIRPRQTRFTQNERYSVDDLIEVYYKNGLWPAIVRVASTDDPPSKTSRYTLWLPFWREQAEFVHSQLRPRLEYKDKKWIPYTVEGARFDEGQVVSVGFYNSGMDDCVLYKGRVLKVIDRSTFLVEYGMSHKVTEILHERFLSERFTIEERDVILKMDMLETERSNEFQMRKWLGELNKVIAKEGQKRDYLQKEKDTVDTEIRTIQSEIYELESKLQKAKENCSSAYDSSSNIKSSP